MATDVIVKQNVQEILEMVYKLGPEFPTMIWGRPGIGKTEATNAIFSRPEDPHEIVLVLAGCSEPTDISGVPFEYKYKDQPVATQILSPIWAWHASVEAPPEYRDKKMVIFFDDIVTGHEQTQAACFKVFGEKKVGNLQLRDNVYIIAAGNRVEDKSAAFEMPMALANRMKHYYADTDKDAWLAWAIKAGVHPLITAYIRKQGQDLNTFEEVLKSSSSEKAFATPRTWEMLSKAMHRMDPSGKIGDWLYAAAVGTVGSGIAIKFKSWCDNTTKLINPEEIIKNPATAPIPGKHEVDVLYATISSLEYYLNKEENWSKWDKALEYVLRDELEAEFGLIIAKLATLIALSKLSEEDRNKAIQNKHFKEMYTRYGTYLANANG